MARKDVARNVAASTAENGSASLRREAAPARGRPLLTTTGPMHTFLVDDRGADGEYAHFLRAHRERLPSVDLEVLSSWAALADRLREEIPDLILLDMHFDDGPVEALCGDLEALVGSARFNGDRGRAEAQMRRLQGVFIAQALREKSFDGPIVLFGTLPQSQSERLTERFGPLRIVEGLLFDGVRDALEWARSIAE